MAIIIQHRNDTAVNWTSVNPILAEGEVGIENDTRLQKVGDGIKAWNDLEYYTYGGASALLPTGGYAGTANDLLSLISVRTEKGTYSGTAGQLKAMIDSLATTGAITPDLKNYMELVKNENGVKAVQGVPAGGQKYFRPNVTGAIKITFPSKGSLNMFSFLITILDLEGRDSILKIQGYFPAISEDIPEAFKVSIISGSKKDYKVSFCRGLTEDYILIGKVTDFWRTSSVKISELQTHYGFDEWDTGWDISVVNTLETLENTNKIIVMPSLNATHINETMTSNSQGGITQKKSSTKALEIQNDAGTPFFNVNTLTGVISAYGLSIYEDNATALANGLVIGDIYKTSIGELRIVY